MMDRRDWDMADGAALHRRVAERVLAAPRAMDWRWARDLTLVLTLSTAGPLAAFAREVGASPAAVWALTAATAAAGLAMAWVLRGESRSVAAFAVGAQATPFQWRRAALRIVPARHRTLAAPEPVVARIGRATTHRPGARP